MPRKTEVQNPADWLDLVASDLELLTVGAERELSYELCRGKLAEVFEKTLKAELVRLGWSLERTHDLLKFSRYLAERDSDLLPEILPLCQALAGAYFTSRYIGFDLEDPDWPTLRAQLEAITALAATIRSRIPPPLP